MSLSVIKVALMASYVVFFSCAVLGMQSIDFQHCGWDESNIDLFTMCWLCSVAPVTNTCIAHEAQYVCRAAEPQTCDWCFNGDGTQASGELRVHAAVRKWPQRHCGTLRSPVHEVPPVNCVLARPCRLGTPIEPCWAFSLGSGTHGRIDHGFKDGHLVSARTPVPAAGTEKMSSEDWV